MVNGLVQLVYPNQSNPLTSKLYSAFQGGGGFAKGLVARNVLKRRKELRHKTVFVRGILRGTGEVIRVAKNFLYMDYGYLHRKQYHRICYNSYICNESNYPSDRFDDLQIDLQDWRTTGKHIVLCPPSTPAQKQYDIYMGVESGWTECVISEIKKYTDRPIIVSTKYGDGLTCFKKKPPKHRFEDVIKNAWVTVVFNSNTMTDSLIRGVPVISLSPDRIIGSISEIENPILDRTILNCLAYNQWTRSQIASGQAWAELSDRYNLC